ncbi:hypothetical protein HEAFMP_HEAFMP_15950, partial [Dysosmobacter welbionis]
AGCLPAGYWFQPQYVPGPGHQHQLHQGAGPDAVQRTGGPVLRPAGPVPGFRGREHGPGRHRHRPCRRHHRRGDLR